MVSSPAALIMPGSLLEMQNLGPHARPTKVEPAFAQDPQVFSRLMKVGDAL